MALSFEDPDVLLEELRRRYGSYRVTGVFTDGGAEPNPGPGGWAVVFVRDGELVERRWGYGGWTTNNRMELTAILTAYRLLSPESKAVIYTDSKLCMNSINHWMDGWVRRGWVTSSKRKVKNVDLLKEIYKERRLKPGVKVEWIPSHSGVLWNEYAHCLASLWKHSGRCGREGGEG